MEKETSLTQRDEDFLLKKENDHEGKTMNSNDKLTQKEFIEILKDSYTKGQEKESIKVVDLIEEIKQKVLLAMEKIN